MNAIDRKFAKTYDVPDAANAFTPHFQYTITVRHQGTVIAFAMDNKRRIFYAVLNMERTGVDSTSDAQYWDIEPKELQFPEELSRVGYRAAGVWKMPVVLENGTELPYGTVVQKSEKDLFASTTARLTESTPFQVLSDEKHIYVFRQAVGKGHPDNYAQTGKPPVDQTLLLDRFVYVGGELRNKLEVRYQRSREKDLPASRKDALGYEDLEKKAFYEPTQELSFIGNLQGGRFSVLLLPTHLPDVQRWQIFAHNSKTQRMDLFSIERAEDGLFNTKGTRYYTSPDKTHQQDVFERQPGECPFTGEPLIPIVGQEGFAESALKLDGIDDYIAVLSAYTLDFAQNEDFTIEVWLQVDASQLEEGSIVDKAGSEPKSPYAIRYRGDGKIVAFRSDGSNPPIEIVADNDIRDGKFHHVAFTKQGSNLSLFVDGVNVGSTQDSLQQNPTTGPSLYFGCRGGDSHFFKGQIDEIRIWSRGRSPEELQDTMHHRLIGNEPELVGYWRFDEGFGAEIYDQTDNANHGQLRILNPAVAAALPAEIQQLEVEVAQIKAETSAAYASPHVNQPPTHLTEGKYTGQMFHVNPLRFTISVPAGLEASLKWKAFPPPKFEAESRSQTIEGGTTFDTIQMGLIDTLVVKVTDKSIEPKQQKLKEQQNLLKSKLKLKNATPDDNWIKSEAPVGEHPGVRRSSFSFEGRTIASGCTALMYYQQEEAEAGYTNEKKPIKRNARVLFAVPTVENGAVNAKNHIAVLDFAVSREGSLAQVPDRIAPKYIDRDKINGRSISDILDEISGLEQDIQNLTSNIREMDIRLTRLNKQVATAPVCDAAFMTNSKVYLFSGSYGSRAYINNAFETKQNMTDDIRRLLPGIPESWAKEGIDAAVNWGGGSEMYIFKGTECLLYNEANTGYTGPYAPPTPPVLLIKDVFKGLPDPSWENGIDAGIRMVIGGVSYGILFKGNQFARFSKNTPNLDGSGYPVMDTGPITQLFPGLPEDWLKDGLDEVFHTGISVFFFKGSKFIEWKVDTEPLSYDLYLADRGMSAFFEFAFQTTKAAKTERDAIEAEKSSKEAARAAKSEQLKQQKQQLQDHLGEFVLSMPFLYADPQGLTVSGAVLGFAWTNQPPRLFESVNGRVSLYFQGQDNQFFAAYYNVLTGRASYIVPTTSGDIQLIARSAGSALNSTTVQISGAEEASTCTVAIDNPILGIKETWNQVPRDAETFASVLNGAAQPLYLGNLAKPVSGQVSQLEVNGRVLQFLSKGSTLLVGKAQTKVAIAETTSEFHGLALEFDGTDDYIQLAEVEKLGLRDRDFTVEAWINVSDFNSLQVPNDRPILGMDKPSSSNQTLHLTVRDSKPYLGFFTNDLAGRTQLNQNTWYHLTWRYTKSTKEQAIFVNGVLDCVQTGRAAFQGTGKLNIGRWESNRYFKGLIGEIRIWNQARTDAEILDDMTRSLSRTLTDTEAKMLAGCWRFERGGNGVIAKDYSKHGRHGTVFGTPQFKSINPKIQLAFTSELTATAGESVYLLPYDYEAQTTTNKVTRSLSQGSLLFVVDSSKASGTVKTNITAQNKGGALTNQWFADSPGSALMFDHDNQPITSLNSTSINVAKFAAKDDLTLEAWVKQGAFPVGLSRVIHYNSASPQSSYALGLFRDSDDNNAQYGVFAKVGDKIVQTLPTQPAGQWQHLAAVFQQSYALKFNSEKKDVINCGSDLTLDLTQDLTLEATIRLNNLEQPQGILTKGIIDDGTNQDCPYSLYINTEGQLVLAFEDKEHANQFVTSPKLIQPGETYRIGVTRKYMTNVKTENANTKVEEWFDICFYVRSAISGAPYEYKQASKYEGSIGSSNQPLEIGRAVYQGSETPESLKACFFEGEIAEVRIWNRALPEAELGKDLKGNEKGLVSWWQLEENQGIIAQDSKSNNHGTITGATWIKSSDANSSRLSLYIDGEAVQTYPWNNSPLPDNGSTIQFALASQPDPSNPREHKFQGQMDEIRIWKVARTEEQIQDHLFRRLIGEFEHLIAYYDCDRANVQIYQTLQDQSGNQLSLPIAIDAEKYFVLSTAPISNETAQVRSALAQVKTSFHEEIASSPSVQEYGDMQYDINGNLIGVMKRCYAYITLDRKWRLITGYKVGDLELEWIGQAQYDPQLVGFIEGAPPVPSENLTVRDGDAGYVYEKASTVELTEAENVMYNYSDSKERGFDTAMTLRAGMGIRSGTEVGFGVMTNVENTNIIFGLKGNMETSNSWIRESKVGYGKNTSKLSRLSVQGDWEAKNRIKYADIGRRYVPKNVGFALVQSETADVFAMRLKHPDPKKRVTVGLTMRPNPDIPKDWNIILFPINPKYVKQGTLDGKVGLHADVEDYPNATDGSSDRSYFKPIEAYALKHRIEKEQKVLESDYQQFNTTPAGATGLAAGAGAGIGAAPGLGASIGSAIGGAVAFSKDANLPKRTRRNMFNTYVWTADGGFFAETQQSMEIKQEVMKGSFSLSGMVGGYTNINTAITKAAITFELESTMGGHLNLTTEKSSDSQTSFGINVDLDVERDIHIKSQEQAEQVGKAMYDSTGYRAKCPGKVDGYRFMSFYLEPDQEHFKDFGNKVVDRVWLEQSSDPNAVALRQAIAKPNSIPWRVLHRVTYVSRVLPEIGTVAANITDETLRAANIESNWELIKKLEPYVKSKTGSYRELKEAVENAIDQFMPELAPAKENIIRYMSLYCQVFEEQPTMRD